MQRREIYLAGMLGVLLLVFVAALCVLRVRGAFVERNQLINGLVAQQAEMKERERQQEELSQAVDRLAERALPGDLGTARRLYHEWLDELVHKPGIDLRSVRVFELEPTPDRGFWRLKYQVNGEGTRAEWTRFLYDFYRADHLHKITSLTAEPKKDSQDVALTIMIEALSLPGSKNKDKLSDAVSSRLQHDDIQPYLDLIVRRNFFGYNKKPELLVSRPLTATPGKEFKYTLRASDPERGTLKYSLISSKANGLKLAPNGQITWQVDENIKDGPYPIAVRVEDDGDPPLSDQKTITINVQRKAIPKEFNHLQFAILEGLLRVGDEPEAWVTLRTTDKHYKLHEGAELTIAGAKVKVLAIDLEAKTLDVEVSGFRRVVRLGESLAEGREGL